MPCDKFRVDSSGNVYLKTTEVKEEILLSMFGTKNKNYLISGPLLNDILNNSKNGLKWMLDKYQNQEHSIYGVIGTERKAKEEKIKNGYRGIAGEITPEQKESALSEILDAWFLPKSIPENWFSN